MAKLSQNLAKLMEFTLGKKKFLKVFWQKWQKVCQKETRTRTMMLRLVRWWGKESGRVNNNFAYNWIYRSVGRSWHIGLKKSFLKSPLTCLHLCTPCSVILGLFSKSRRWRDDRWPKREGKGRRIHDSVQVGKETKGSVSEP